VPASGGAQGTAAGVAPETMTLTSDPAPRGRLEPLSETRYKVTFTASTAFTAKLAPPFRGGGGGSDTSAHEPPVAQR